MRSDLAALTPPLVMAAAFIAGVVALLRREMAPTRRRHKKRPQQADLPLAADTDATSPERGQTLPVRHSRHGEDGSGDNSG